MSHVTGVVLVYDTDFRAPEDVLRDVNAYPGFRDGEGLTELTPHMGGTKWPQLEVAGGGFNYLDIPAFLAHLRAVDWGGGYGWANVAIQDEHDQGAGWVSIYRGPDANDVGSVFSERSASREIR